MQKKWYKMQEKSRGRRKNEKKNAKFLIKKDREILKRTEWLPQMRVLTYKEMGLNIGSNP